MGKDDRHARGSAGEQAGCPCVPRRGGVQRRAVSKNGAALCVGSTDIGRISDTLRREPTTRVTAGRPVFLRRRDEANKKRCAEAGTSEYGNATTSTGSIHRHRDRTADRRSPF